MIFRFEFDTSRFYDSVTFQTRRNRKQIIILEKIVRAKMYNARISAVLLKDDILRILFFKREKQRKEKRLKLKLMFGREREIGKDNERKGKRLKQIN